MSYHYNRRHRRFRMPKFTWMLVALAFVATLAIGIPACGSYYAKSTVTTLVTDKERVCDGEECKYLIFTEAGTFELTDAVFGTYRSNSSDVYGRIREGEVYVIKSYGWRFGCASMYPNIDKITPVES